jgi:membrane protease YdiL (CAAX protease family)
MRPRYQGQVHMSSTQGPDQYVSGASVDATGRQAGLRGTVRRRPLTAFLVIVFGIGWPILAVAVLASHHIIPGAGLPVEVFALTVTLLVMLPGALWVTAVTEGRPGVRALMGRAFRWRFGVGWWAVVLFGLPVIALALGLIFGGSLNATSAGEVLLRQLLSVVLAVVVINLWEETVWAGFFQTRLEGRYPLVVAAVLTAVPFAGVHMPLLLIGDHITTWSVLKGIGGLLILGVVVRLLIGVVMRAAADSVLAVGVLHQLFDASNNKGGVVDSFLDGADEGVMALVATVLLTAAVAAVCSRRPGFFGKRVTGTDRCSA